MSQLNHPILKQSFAIIDQAVGEHSLTPAEYAIVRRIIHATADFDFLSLTKFSPKAIASGIQALRAGSPIVTDVNMVAQGIKTMVEKTRNNPVISAINYANNPKLGKTRTETGMELCYQKYPQAIYVIGNAPTALLNLCEQITLANSLVPPLIVGVPVGFVSVVESKTKLANLNVPQIRVEGRKGGSSVAAAIVNALLVLSLKQ